MRSWTTERHVRKALDDRILVPFPVESSLSGVGAAPTRRSDPLLHRLEKDRDLPALRESLDKLPTETVRWFGNRHLIFRGAKCC